MVQGRSADLQRGRAGLLGQPESDPRAEHPGDLGEPGDPDGRCGGLPRRRRTVGRCDRPALPRRQLRPAWVGRRPRHVCGAEGEGDQERAAGDVLGVRVLRAGDRDRQGTVGEFERPFGGSGGQQRLGLCHQLHSRKLSLYIAYCFPVSVLQDNERLFRALHIVV